MKRFLSFALFVTILLLAGIAKKSRGQTSVNPIEVKLEASINKLRIEEQLLGHATTQRRDVAQRTAFYQELKFPRK